MNISNYLNKPFIHHAWFTKIDPNTGLPEISNKLALMYFAASGDFILNTKETAILYTGKEHGSARGKIRIQYFKYLKNLIAQTKLIAIDKAEHSKQQNFGFIHLSKDQIAIIATVKYYNSSLNPSPKPYYSFYFVDYLKKFAPSTYKALQREFSL